MAVLHRLWPCRLLNPAWGPVGLPPTAASCFFSASVSHEGGLPQNAGVQRAQRAAKGPQGVGALGKALPALHILSGCGQCPPAPSRAGVPSPGQVPLIPEKCPESRQVP